MQNLEETTQREKLLQNREAKFAAFLDNLDKIQDTRRAELLRDINEIYGLILQLDMNKDLENMRKDKRIKGFYQNISSIFSAKYMKTVFLSFLVGIILTLIPTLLYISNLKKDDLPVFHFIPNAMVERKPTYLQILETPEQVEVAQNADFIYRPSPIQIGDGVGLNASGLGVFRKEQLSAEDMHVKNVGPQTNMRQVVNGYQWIPNAILTAEPLAVQVLEDEDQVRAARKLSDLTYKEFLGVGSAIGCQKGVPCYVLAKKSLADRFTIKPFKHIEPRA